MAYEKTLRGGVGTSAWRKALALALTATLALSGCNSYTASIPDDDVPLAAELVAASQEIVEEDPAYSQTLEDGTVVASDSMDVSEMDIEVVTVEEEAPQKVELPAEATDRESATGSLYGSDEMAGVMATSLAAVPLDAAPVAAPLTGGSGLTSVPTGGSYTIGSMTISGGAINTDYTASGTTVVINTSTPLALSGTFTGTVQVAAGVEAWIVLNGVTITGNNNSSPINLMADSQAHIILADGTTNTLNANALGCAGLHCGLGSTLWIDDAVVNYDFSAKKHIEVTGGKVATDGTVTNMSDGSSITVATGDILSKITSTGVVGKLIVKGGSSSAGIGAGPNEIAGTMVFDGGYVETYSYGGHKNNGGTDSTAIGVGATNQQGSNASYSSGTGIGGGSGATSGASNTTFNSGTIYSYGSYHGAGIGAGWGSSGAVTARQTGASTATTVGGINFSKNAGNININGGYILSQGYAHGNAFGGACGTNMNSCYVRITGGTLRPYSYSGGSYRDIGGSGGHVVISGGSISLTGDQATEFMSGDSNKAFSDEGLKNEVVPITVDLAAETGVVDYTITSWALYLDGVLQDYGAPSTFNGGKLCLWLPPTAKTQKVTVELNYYNEEKGSEVLVEPLYRDAGSDSTNVKRNVYFDMPMEVFGDVETAVEPLPAGITNFPNELLVNGKVPETVTLIKKEYDGLPFDTISVAGGLTITESNSGETRTLTNDEKVTYSYRTLNGNTFSDELTSAQMPSNTGLMTFAMNSTEYAQGEWGKSYIGHRSNGWCEITPVPAVLTLEGAEWGNLNLETGEWKATTSADDEPGNRIKVTFNVRSAIGTMPTCKTPTGSVQLAIDGKKFGQPILLDEATIEADGFSTYDVTEGPTDASANTQAAIDSPDNRWTAHVVYYMDPAQADGLLNPKSSFKVTSKSQQIDDEANPLAAMVDSIVRMTADGEAYADGTTDVETEDGNKYQLTAEYIPDKNYVEGVEANPQNADATATIIVPVDSPVKVTDDQGDTYDFTEVDPTDPTDPNNPSGGTPNPGGTSGGGKTYTASVVKNYSDFHKKDADGNETIEKDYFTLQIDSSSAMPMTWVSSDPAVADVMRDAEGNVVLDENGDPKVVVYSCGQVTLTMHQPGNAVYNEQTRIIDMTVIPDQNLKPETEARVIWQNLTHPGMPAAPGDVIEYTVVGSNLTDGSSWQNVNLGDVVPGNVTVNPDSVEVAKNFESPEDLSSMTAEDLADLPFEKADDATVTKDAEGNSTVSANVGSVYGGQSTAVKFTVTVNDGIADRDSITNENPPTIPNTPVAEGSYGVMETQDLVPGTSAGDGESKPVDDTKIYGIDADANPEAMVLPKDPTVGGNESDVYVNKTAENLTRQSGITLPGDTIRYAITVGNSAPDSCLYWPVIRDTLPAGVTPVPGSFVLTRVDGTQVPVGDNVFVKSTNTVALYVDDLFGGEETTLTFDCTVGADASMVENTAQVMGTLPSEKYLEEFPPPLPENPDGDNPDDPSNPDDLDGSDPSDPNDPSNPGNPDGIDPDNPDNPDGDNPDNPNGSDPAGADPDSPDGTDPTNPGGTDPDDPNKVTPPWPPTPGQPWTPDRETSTEDYPWDDFDWDEYTEENDVPDVHNPEPATPGVLIPATDPSINGDLLIEKTAENLTNGTEGDSYVGDRVRYTITVTDTKAGTAWFDVIVRDNLPRGLAIDMETAKVVTAQGVEAPVSADAYNEGTRVLAVNVGDVPGGKTASLIFEAVITEEALDGDIGNTATAYGTLPSEVNPDDMVEGKRPEPGSGFKPNEGWDAYERLHESLGVQDAAYPSANAASNGIKPADESPALIEAQAEAAAQGGSDGSAGNGGRGDGWGTDVFGKVLRLAQTGDPAVLSAIALVVLAAGAAIVLLVARRRKDEEDAA